MLNLKKLDSQFSKLVSHIFRIFSLWIFGDVIYAVLPLIVLLIIYKLLHKPFDHFLELKEWSFATIVLYGVMIRKFVRVKVLLQQSPRSFKLDGGMQFLTVLLIVSVLVLALVILAEEHILPENILGDLGRAQIFLFSLALASLLAGTMAEDEGILWAGNSKSNIQDAKLLKLTLRELNEANRLAQYVLQALDKSKTKMDIINSEQPESKRIEAQVVQHISLTLDQLDHAIVEIRQQLNLQSLPISKPENDGHPVK